MTGREWVAARATYRAEGMEPGKRVPMAWSGRVCHAHQLAFADPAHMGPHFSRAHMTDAVAFEDTPLGWAWAALDEEIGRLTGGSGGWAA